MFFLNFGPEMGSRRAGRGLKRFLEAVGFILAEFGPKPMHGDPIRGRNRGLGTYDMCWNIEIYAIYIYIEREREKTNNFKKMVLEKTAQLAG